METAVTTLESVMVWALLAFALWLAMTLVLVRAGLKSAAAVAALLSWFVARLAMSWLPLLLDWISRRPGA